MKLLSTLGKRFQLMTYVFDLTLKFVIYMNHLLKRNSDIGIEYQNKLVYRICNTGKDRTKEMLVHLFT